jgi:signal transduction histidine kinase
MNEPGEQEVIVVIDDDAAMRLSCRKILAKAGYRVETFEDGAQGLEGVARLKPGLAVVDLKMPGLSGLEVIARVHQLDPLTVVVVITGYATIDTAVEAIKAGAYDFLPKPFSPEELRLIVGRALERRRLVLDSRRGEMERELLKRRFVTFVSHQLQTPLAAVHQYLSVLRQLEDLGEAGGRRREWIERCLKRSEEMQTIIRDWLTLARLEGDRLVRQCARVDLRQIIPNILATYAEMAAAERVTLEARLPEEAAWVRGDLNCLNVLFDNLIVNAIKYNRPGGRVTISAEALGGEVEVAVADTGVGIPPQYQEFLFDEFFRIRGEGAKKTAGTGLGLSIAKKIVTELGGSIAVVSEPGVGSTFRVRLPAWREPAAEEGRDGSAA